MKNRRQTREIEETNCDASQPQTLALTCWATQHNQHMQAILHWAKETGEWRQIKQTATPEEHHHCYVSVFFLVAQRGHDFASKCQIRK
jgi:hypothetical protein